MKKVVKAATQSSGNKKDVKEEMKKASNTSHIVDKGAAKKVMKKALKKEGKDVKKTVKHA
jgi:hypothetical protein